MILAFKLSDLITVPFGFLLGLLNDVTGNYGIAIAQMHGILRRSLEPFPEILALLDE